MMAARAGESYKRHMQRVEYAGAGPPHDVCLLACRSHYARRCSDNFPGDEAPTLSHRKLDHSIGTGLRSQKGTRSTIFARSNSVGEGRGAERDEA